MGKLAEKKVALAAQILLSDDEGLLRSVDELLNGRSFRLSSEELKDLERMRKRYLAGDGKSSPWPEVEKRLRKKLRG